MDAKIRIDVQGVADSATDWFTWNAYWAPRYSADTTVAANKTGCCGGIVDGTNCTICPSLPLLTDDNAVCDKSYDETTTNTMSFDGLPTTEYAYGDTYTSSDTDNVECYA